MLRLFDRDDGAAAAAVRTEHLLWAGSAFWLLAANGSFLGQALQGRDPSRAATWGFALALGVVLASVHFLMLAPLATRRTVKPLLGLGIVVTALASHYVTTYHVYLDPTMLRNVLHSEPAEARELLSWRLALHLALYAGLPLALLWRVRVAQRPWRRALAARLGHVALALALGLGALISVFPSAASLMRNHKELRYLITPANVVWSAAATLVQDARGAARPRHPIGTDAVAGPRMAARARPLVVVLVVGETARAANWGLSGYPRPTTPELARLPVINFAEVEACGTNTEVSLPCMFAPVGRRDYDEDRIRGSESLLHVAARAGVQVLWRDNQSGCKGVCDGLPTEEVASLNPPGLCSDGRCLDEGLLAGLDERLARAQGTQLWVLHMLGNHGPSYFRRYPKAFERFQPACQDDDLSRCSREAIVNAYDNALVYTDHVLASLVAKLQAQSGRVDSVMLFVSDHGESLGESGLYLHGVPFAVAPNEQTRVPMVAWLSDGAPASLGLEPGCLRARAAKPASHGNLFHTLMGWLDVRSRVYEPGWDLDSGCRASP